MANESLLDLERKAKALIDKLSRPVLASRLRRERLAQKLSIQELAERAQVAKSSIVRLEAGTDFRPVMILKVCAALGLHLDRLGSGDGEGSVAIHRRTDDRWHELTNFGGGVLGGIDQPLTGEQRRHLVAKGARNPIMLLNSRLNEGKVLPTLIEVYEPSETRSHPGEEFVFVLRGRLRITVAGVGYELSAGESADFWGTEPHAYEPVGEEAALILSLRVNP